MPQEVFIKKVRDLAADTADAIIQIFKTVQDKLELKHLKVKYLAMVKAKRAESKLLEPTKADVWCECFNKILEPIKSAKFEIRSGMNCIVMDINGHKHLLFTNSGSEDDQASYKATNLFLGRFF